MRRQPITQTRGNVGRRPLAERRYSRRSRPSNMPAPVRGWNRRDGLAFMDSRFAVNLSNWFPRQNDCITRPGYSEHCDTGENAVVEMLLQYEFGAVAATLACVNGKIIDVTTSTPDELEGSLTSNLWSSTMLLGNMILANGADVVKKFDGSAVTDPAFTGVTLSDLIHVQTYKGRLYFVEKNTQSMWYGGTGSVAGALTEFDFGGVSSVKGNLVLTTHLKGDGGDGGNDDMFVALFASGDVLAYTGSNPGDAENWSLKGHYRIGRPLSRFGIVDTDDDVVITTSRGYVKLSQVLRYGNALPDKLLLSDQIQQAVTEAVDILGESDGWRAFMYPKGQMLIVTVPGVNDARHYHVQNINTKAWCRFDDFIAYCWSLQGDQPLFGGDSGKIYAFDDGTTSDNGVAIRCDAQPAWTPLGSPGYNKHVHFVKPYFVADTVPSVSVTTGTEYQSIGIGEFTAAGSGEFDEWDIAEWDDAQWAAPETVFTRLFPQNRLGDAIGVRIVVNVSAFSVKWNQTTIIHSPGGLL